MSRDAAVAFTLERERGWYAGHDTFDHNPTLDGVTQHTYDTYRTRQHLPLQSVRLMTPIERQAIYEQFWEASLAALVPAPADIAHFAFYFNTKPERAFRALQRALGVESDGIVGPVTRAALAAANGETLLPALLLEQLAEYRSIAQGNPSKRPALLSWIGRLVTCWQQR